MSESSRNTNKQSSPPAWAGGLLCVFFVGDFLLRFPENSLPQAGQIGGPGGVFHGVGAVQVVFPRLPGVDGGLVVLDHGLKFVQGLIDAGLRSLLGGHLPVQGVHLRPIRGGQGVHPLMQQPLLPYLVLRRFAEGGDIAGEALPQVVDQAHADDPVHIRLRKLVPQPEGHQGDAPAVLCHAFRAAVRGAAVAGGVLQPLRRVQSGQQIGGIHGGPPYLRSLPTGPGSRAPAAGPEASRTRGPGAAGPSGPLGRRSSAGWCRGGAETPSGPPACRGGW